MWTWRTVAAVAGALLVLPVAAVMAQDKGAAARPIVIIDGQALPNEDVLLTTAFVTVGLSVLAHGVSAAPLATRYAGWLDAHPRADVGVETGAGEPGPRWRLAPSEERGGV